MSSTTLQRRRQRPVTADTATTAQLSPSSLRLVSYEDAPDWIKRPYITSGYLLGGSPWAAARDTLFKLNNETVNAWTMILGIAAALTGFALAWVHRRDSLSAAYLMVLSALPHLPASIRLHCTIGVSEQVRDFWRTMDVFMIFTCAVPRAAALGWHVFETRQGYAVFMALTLAVYTFCIFSTMVRRQIKNISKPTLAKDVTVTVLCYTLPMLVQTCRELKASGPGPATALYGAIFALLILASSAYSLKFPERWAPGKFDLIANSHQVMHTSVVIEYCLEWAFVFHMTRPQESVLTTALPVDELGRLFSHLASPQLKY